MVSGRIVWRVDLANYDAAGALASPTEQRTASLIDEGLVSLSVLLSYSLYFNFSTLRAPPVLRLVPSLDVKRGAATSIHGSLILSFRFRQRSGHYFDIRDTHHHGKV